jgi:hypothetical protein
MMKLRPKNWQSFQHYKDRRPPWIKLYRNLLDDRDYLRLPTASRALAPCLWLLASESETGEFDGSVDNIAFRLRLSDKEVEQGLKPLIEKGFFEVASNALADCLQNAIPETERETENRDREQRERQRQKAAQMPKDFAPSESHQIFATEHGVNLAAEFDAFSDYHRSKGSTFKDWDAALRTWLRNAKKFAKPVPAKPVLTWRPTE